MSYLIDSHCHIQLINQQNQDPTSLLWSKKASVNVDQVLKDAIDNNVKSFIVVGCSLTDSILAVNLAKKYPFVYPSIGIHPHEAETLNSDIMLKFEELCSTEQIKAIGECGLDFFYQHASKNKQITALIWQLELAKKYNLPIIFHVRSAFDDFWPIYDKYRPLRGVLHSFTDTRANLEKALDRDLLIGVNGIATFSKDPDQIEMYRSIPLDNLILETDSPYLTPVPVRGTINEPKNVLIITHFIAKLKNKSFAEITLKTNKNTINLFNLEYQENG